MSFFQTLIPALNRTPASTENTPGSVETATIKPTYEIKETAEAYGVIVYLPGVAKDGLEITADDAEVRITGRRAWQRPDGWTALYRENPDAAFELVLAHDNAVDTAKISAELRDGVLRASLPKHEAAKPRKISINGAV